jgi:CheY-like chemotaxis protein
MTPTGSIAMNDLLLIDDEAKDLKTAATAAESLGIPNIRTRNTIHGARSYLEEGLADKIPLPDGIVLDLDLGIDSGFELLRWWHSTPRLRSIPLIIWSVVEQQREMCEYFGIAAFVSKWDGPDALRAALGKL